MEELEKLKDLVNDLTCMLDGEFSDYEAHDIAIKMLLLQEQRKTNAILDVIEENVR
jgi:hypothetical protein